MPDSYANADDLADRWRPLTPDETTKATTLLADASYWLRRWFPDRCAVLDSGGDDPRGALIVVCNMVKRALMAQDLDGVQSQSQTQGPFNVSRTFANPQGNLFVTEAERAEFVGPSQFRSVRMVGL